MKKNIKFVLLFYIFTATLIFQSCSPVRNTTFRNSKNVDNNTENIVEESAHKQRFIDTTLVQLPDVVQSSTHISNEFGELFNSALIDFDNKQFKSAEKKFSSIKSTLNEDDSLYYEAEFYLIECIIAENQILNAKKRLELLFMDKRLSDNLLERVLVRLGQIHCALNDKKNAIVFFSKLENLNPNSIYMKVANCEFLDKRAK